MRKLLPAVIIVGLGVGFVAGSAVWAQRPSGGSPNSTGILLVDVAAITKSSARAKQSMEALKKKYEADGAALKQEGEQGNAMTEKLRKMPPGPERTKLEQDLVKRRADFELRGKRVTAAAAEGETKVYASLSQEIKEELARHAAATGAKLVLRYEPNLTEFPDRQAVATEIQRLIVYQRDAEITPVVAEAVNRRAGGTSRAAAPAKSVPR
jgi:Skp family chaperone for outer membrane proteins